MGPPLCSCFDTPSPLGPMPFCWPFYEKSIQIAPHLLHLHRPPVSALPMLAFLFLTLQHTAISRLSHLPATVQELVPSYPSGPTVTSLSFPTKDSFLMWITVVCLLAYFMFQFLDCKVHQSEVELLCLVYKSPSDMIKFHIFHFEASPI
jgi:hypothetical protein